MTGATNGTAPAPELTADEALAYGIIDEIITSRGLTPELATAAAGGA